MYLNLVLDYVPETVYRVARHYSRAKQTLPMVYVKVSKCVCLCPLPSIYHHNIRSIISQSAMSGHSSTLCATKCFFWKEIVKEMVIFKKFKYDEVYLESAIKQKVCTLCEKYVFIFITLIFC